MISIYLHYDGTCEEAFKFYEKELGAKTEMMLRYSEGPPEMPCPPTHKDKIMHGRTSIGGVTIMGSDAPPDHFQKPQGFSVSLTVADPAEAEAKFKTLSAGGNVTMPFGKTFWAKGFGMCHDRFGIPWMVNCPQENA